MIHGTSYSTEVVEEREETQVEPPTTSLLLRQTPQPNTAAFQAYREFWSDPCWGDSLDW
jgi:hypothetical protein